MPVIRPMTEEDAPAVHALAVHTFDTLDRSMGVEPDEPPPNSDLRYTHCVATDPGGCWVAEAGDGALVAAAIALLRGEIWGLSLLVVHPDSQSSGLGGQVLARAADYGRHARGRIILSSSDPRALRTYARLGLQVHPCLAARGVPQGVAAPAGVREGTVQDIPFTEEVDRHVRNAAHGSDIAVMLELGGTLLIAPEHGYAVTGNGSVRVLAAFDTRGAQDLLRAALARSGDGAAVNWLSARQQWAVDVCLDARLNLDVKSGAVFVDGDVGPFTPYLPSGAFL